jgi:hypothetical protein
MVAHATTSVFGLRQQGRDDRFRLYGAAKPHHTNENGSSALPEVGNGTEIAAGKKVVAVTTA